MNNKNKQLLFIYISFFGYEKYIQKSIKNFGFDIYAFDERLSNGKIIKVIYRYVPPISKLITLIYFQWILMKVKSINKIDVLFVLKGEVVPVWFIKKVKKKHPLITMIYYTWDSFANNPNAIKLYHQFDKAFSFDTSDCDKYGLMFRPLFSVYNPKIPENSNKKVASTILTAHSDRISVLQNIESQLRSLRIDLKCYIYTRLKLFDRIRNIKVKNRYNSKLRSKSLTIKECFEFLNDAEFIIDINHPNQSGLTMRTFEALVFNKKLITTNHNIRNYSFYNPVNILVINRTQVVLDSEFFRTKFEKYPEDLSHAMTINGWIEELFFESKVVWRIKNIHSHD